MTLTLTDAASGPLRGFVGILEQIRGLTTGLGRQLDGVAVGIGNVSRNAGTGDRNVAGMTGALMGMEAALNGVLGRLTALNTGLAATGAEGRAAGAGVLAGTTAMTGGMAGANAQASTLMTTLRAMGQLYAAAKIKDGLVASATGAIDFETARTRAQNMGMTAAERGSLQGAAIGASRSVPQFDRLQAFDMAVDLRNALNSVDAATAILPEMAKLAYNLKANTPAGQTFDPKVLLDIGKILQQRDAVYDPARLRAETDMLLQIYTATQGRVEMGKMLVNLRQAKGGLGDDFSLDFIPVLASIVEQSGAKGGEVGTQLTSLYRYVAGNVKNGLSAKEAERLGLIDRDGLQWNSLGNIDLKKSELRMRGAGQFMQNPLEWVREVLVPAMQRAGIDTGNNDQVNATMARLFPNRNAADIASFMATKGRAIDADVGITKQSLGNLEQYANTMKTAEARIEAVKGQFRDLGIVLGETFLPAIKVVAEGLANAFRSMSAFFEANPVVATMATWAAAFAGVALAISGMAGLFGVAFGPLVSMLSGPVAAAVRGFFGAMSGLWAFLAPILPAIGSAVASMASAVGAVLLRLVPVIGTFLAAWNVGGLIGNLQIGGQSIQLWAADLIEWVVNAFKRGWAAIGNIVTSILPASQAAQSTGIAGPSGERRGTMPRTGLAALREEAGRTLPDTGAGGGRGAVNPALVVPTASRPSAPVVSVPLFESADGPARTPRGRAPSAAAQLRERFNTSAITDANESYRADFLRSEKGAYTAAPVATGKTAAELDAIELQVKRDLLQTAGQRREAEAQRIKDELDGNLRLLVSAKRITQEEADQASARAQAAVELRKQQTDTATAQETYKRQLLEIDAAERNGLIGELEAANRRQAVRKQEAAALNEMLAKELALAEARGDTEGAAKLRTAMSQNTVTLGELSPEMTQVLRTARTGVEGFFSSIMSGTKSAKQAFRDLGQSILQTINDLVAQKLAGQLFDSLFGGTAGGGALGTPSGGGGSGIFDWLGKLFGGTGSTAGAAGGGGGWMDWIGSLFSSNSGGGGGGWISAIASLFGGSFADGLDYVPRDMLAMVHEGEKITPAKFNPDNPRNRGSSGGGPLIGSMHFNVPAPTDTRTQQQLAAIAGAAVSRASSRVR